MNQAASSNPKRATGAVQSKTGFTSKWRSYWGHHRSSLFGSLGRLLATPVQTLMTAMVVAIALALPAILLVSLNNVQVLGKSWDAQPKISAYLNVRARETAIEKLVEELSAYREVEEVVYLSAEQALADFQQFSGFGEVLSGLDDNPLPATLVITPKPEFAAPGSLKLLGERIAASPVVQEVGLDMDWVRRLQELMQLGKKIVGALALLLGLGVLLAIGNTIRLAIENRREEILVTKLVGGTNGFVRRPFLYSGGWYGFLGGLLAWLIVMLALSSLSGTVERLATLYQSNFSLQGIGYEGGLKLLALSTVLGWVGAWLAVGRHLAQIEPK